MSSLDADATVRISRAIEDVWAVVGDALRTPEWVDAIANMTHASTETGVGATYAGDFSYRGKTFPTTFLVTAYEAPRLFAMASEDGPFPFRQRLTLAPDGDGASVTNWIEAGSDGWFTAAMFVLARPLLRVLMRRQLRSEVEALRALLDGPAGGT